MEIPWSSDMQGRCLKHPERRPSPGVCSFCLRERLAHLSHCKPSSTSSTSLSTSYSYYSYSSSSTEPSFPSTPPLPPISSWVPQEVEEEARVSSLLNEEARLPEKAGRFWPLRRSRSAAYEVKRGPMMEKKKTCGAGGSGAAGGGLWSLLMMKGRKEVAEEKGKGRSWRFGQTKVVKDIISLGVR